MIAQGVILLVLAAAAIAVGLYGRNHAPELVDMISDPDLHGRRISSIRRGSVATIAVGAVLAVAGIASLIAGAFG